MSDETLDWVVSSVSRSVCAGCERGWRCEYVENVEQGGGYLGG